MLRLCHVDLASSGPANGDMAPVAVSVAILSAARTGQGRSPARRGNGPRTSRGKRRKAARRRVPGRSLPAWGGAPLRRYLLGYRFPAVRAQARLPRRIRLAVQLSPRDATLSKCVRHGRGLPLPPCAKTVCSVVPTHRAPRRSVRDPLASARLWVNRCRSADLLNQTVDRIRDAVHSRLGKVSQPCIRRTHEQL